MTKDGLEDLYQKFLSCGVISTDTRNLPKGCLYLSLKGINFNGNTFADQALNDGAAYVVVDEVTFAISEKHILVKDGLKTLQALASRHRESFNIPVLGITGSNGKTTTKELLAAVLTKHFKTHVTKGNLNNHIGVPLTILSMPVDTEVAVIEMGANHIGDNEELCDIFNPNLGLITNIGKEHLEGFGDLEGVALGNSELYAHILANDGKAFVNVNDEILMRMAARLKYVVSYAVDSDADYSAISIRLNPDILLEKIGHYKVQSHLFGRYNADNVMAAVAISSHLGVPVEKIQAGIAEYIPSNNRSQVVEHGSNTIIVDCYNANPSSMEVAIKNFCTIDTDKQKILILGDMFEMGEHEAQEHELIAHLANSLNPIKTILCGKAFEAAAKGHSIDWYPTTQDLKSQLKTNPISNSIILLKGSRGMKMESLLDSI
ncbi:MAG: UDP-N-acetylmuramoyl-tripeptide--D-alanyl-D-alanine ligase [Flavobacteriaceae bacterium]|nr:UDP-N-acetylmuramoyl-tripeptide--D-alanyl-D-alanine ligase [Flavobacteriaceae bacterium]